MVSQRRRQNSRKSLKPDRQSCTRMCCLVKDVANYYWQTITISLELVLALKRTTLVNWCEIEWIMESQQKTSYCRSLRTTIYIESLWPRYWRFPRARAIVANLRPALCSSSHQSRFCVKSVIFVGFSENYAVESGSVGVSHTGAIKIANLDAGQPVHLI